ALEAALSKEQINCFLKLIKSIHCGSNLFTLNEYSDLCSTWWAASHCMMAFKKEIFCIDGIDDEPHEFPMYYCLLMDWTTNLLKHPGVGPHFIFDAMHLFKFNGSTFVHFIDEPCVENGCRQLSSDSTTIY
ncbi:hypothetical protein F5141DRAFT_1009916, partial [Pisolithus sp. B1]